MVLALAAAYVELGGLPWMQALFYGIGAAVIAIIARSVQKLTKLTLAKDPLLWAVFAVNAAMTALTESELVWGFVASGVLVYLVRIRPGLATLVVLVKARKLPEPIVIIIAGLVGVAITR
jgi:chromate transporter